MSALIRLAPIRVLLWWLADRNILRPRIEEAFKKRLLRQAERAHTPTAIDRRGDLVAARSSPESEAGVVGDRAAESTGT